MKYPGPQLEILHERYSRALFDVALEAGKLEDVFSGLGFLTKSTEENVAFSKILENPEIDKNDKQKVLETLSEKMRLPEELLSFMRVLVKKSRTALLHGVFLKYRDLYDKRKGIVKVFVETAKPLKKEMITRLEENLEQGLKKDITIIESRAPALVGGIDIKIGGSVYKSSIADRLRLMKEKLMQRS